MNYRNLARRAGMGGYTPGNDPRDRITTGSGEQAAKKAGGFMVVALVVLGALLLRRK
jgi:uncharacterized protein (TIGR03382 family)